MLSEKIRMSSRTTYLPACVTALAAMCWTLHAAAAPGSHDLSVVMGEGAAKSYAVRGEAARALPKNLSPEEIHALYGLLQRKAGDDPAPANHLDAIKNEVANALKSQDHLPPDLVAVLSKLFRDQGQGEAWRDYCIQHLGDVYARLKDNADQKLARETIWSATSEKMGSIPGTALIALLNRKVQPGFEKKRITDTAKAMIRSSDYGEPAKITAFQACAKLGDADVLQEARQVVDSGTSVQLRKSAIAYLGFMGGVSDIDRLKRHVSGAEVRLRVPAQAALKRLAAAGMKAGETR